MAGLKDETGNRFGRLLVLRRAPDAAGGKAAWVCLCDCGAETAVRANALRTGNTKSCGCLYREKHPGRRMHKGYVLLYRPAHPNATRAGYVPEHVAVMAEFIGRPLQDREEVHHVNGVRSDNRLRNLELWSTSHPKGQRIVDLVDWAREIIATYGGVAA